MDGLKDQPVLAKREQTRATLNNNLEQLEGRLNDKIREVRTAISRSTDVPYQVRQRPWKMLGLSVGTGYLIGRIFSGGRRYRRARESVDATTSSRGGIIKGAILGILAALLRESMRQAAPALIAYLKDYSKRPGRRRDSHRKDWQPTVDQQPEHHSVSQGS